MTKNCWGNSVFHS